MEIIGITLLCAMALLLVLRKPLLRGTLKWRLRHARKARDKQTALIARRWNQWDATPPFAPLGRQVIEGSIEQLLKPRLARAQARVSELEVKLASL